MITDFTVKPNPHAIESKSVSKYESGRYTTYLPKFTVHPGWNLNGDAGLYAKIQRLENGEMIEAVVGPVYPSVQSGRDYEYTYDDLSPLVIRDYDYTDAWGDRHYQKILEMWLVLNYDGTGRVIVKDGKVVIHNGKVVIDR